MGFFSGAGIGAGLGFLAGGPVGAGIGAGIGGMIGQDSENKNAQQQKLYESNLYGQNQSNYNNAMSIGKQLQDQVMGQSAKDVGAKATEYQNMLYGGLNKDAISSEAYKQKSDIDISKANAKAGIAGVDTTAGKEQAGRG